MGGTSGYYKGGAVCIGKSFLSIQTTRCVRVCFSVGWVNGNPGLMATPGQWYPPPARQLQMARNKQVARKQTISPEVRALIERRRVRIQTLVPAPMREVLDGLKSVSYTVEAAADDAEVALNDVRTELAGARETIDKLRQAVLDHFEAGNSDDEAEEKPRVWVDGTQQLGWIINPSRMTQQR